MAITRDRLLAMTAALSAFVFVGIPVYLLQDNLPPYTYLDGVVVPDPAYSGDQVRVDWTIKVNRLCRGAVQRELVDSRDVTHSYDATPASLSVRPGDRWLSRTFTLPLNMPAGRTRYRARVCYVCNPLQVFWPLCTFTPDIVFELGER